MKVVVAHNRYREAVPSGENVIVDTEIAQLEAAGVEVVPFLRSSDSIRDLPPAQKALLPLSPISGRAAQRDLAALLTEHRPDVVHLHNPYPLLSPAVITTAHRYGVPVVQTVHNYRHVCAAYTLFRDGHICRDCVGRRFPTPAVVHRCYRGSRAQSAVLASALAVHRRTFHQVDRFIALAAGVADFLREYGIPDERIVIKPNSVPDPGPHDLPGEGFLFVGRLSPEKGLALLLAAWREHPVGALGKLRVAGDGPQRDLAEQAAAERADIEFVGRATPGEVRELMRRSAVLVVPSQWHDVLPTVIIEALANARPVLATALGGMPWMIDKAGWTVPANSAALAAALPTAAAEASGRYAVARERYLSTFTPELVLDQLLAVYRDLAAARSG